ncbi:MAG: hypothetical protein WC716_11360 [Chitinophagaceae bacterium]|jgi:hypothetical protein
MKKTLSILSLTILPALSFGQKYARTIDSLTKTTIGKLGGIDKMKFELLLRQIQSNHVYKRMDSVKCDFVYIEAHTNHRDTNLTEWYFNTPYQGYYFVQPDLKNVLPSMVFNDGKEMDFRLNYFSKTVSGVAFSNIYEKYFTLDEIKARVKNFKPVQELTYDDTPPMAKQGHRNRIADSLNGKIVQDTTKATKMAEQLLVNELKMTHKIIIWIDKKTKTAKISLQTPAKSPKVTSYPVSIEYQDW